MYAAESGNLQIVVYLLQHGAYKDATCFVSLTFLPFFLDKEGRPHRCRYFTCVLIVLFKPKIVWRCRYYNCVPIVLFESKISCRCRYFTCVLMVLFVPKMACGCYILITLSCPAITIFCCNVNSRYSLAARR